MFLCLFAAYPCVTSLRFSYASLCYSITVPIIAFALSGSTIQGRTPLFISQPFLCKSTLCPSISVLSCAVHISAIPLQINSVRRRSLPFLFCSIAYLLCAVPLPYCTQLFPCLSTDRRSAPFLCSVSLCFSIALLLSAAPFHCFADPFYTSLRYSVALLFPAAPFHIIAQPFNVAALLFFTIPSLNSSLLFLRQSSLSRQCHSSLCRFYAYPISSLPFHCHARLFLLMAFLFFAVAYHGLSNPLPFSATLCPCL